MRDAPSPTPSDDENDKDWDSSELQDLLKDLDDANIPGYIGDLDWDDIEDLLLEEPSLIPQHAMADLEQALGKGVVPVSANVGDDSLPGDYNWDPLNLSTKDYFLPVQTFLVNLVDFGNKPPPETKETIPPRPRALILRDYREAEIRHGRIAMLAAMIWPLEEMLDRFVFEDDGLFGPILYGPVTLPYFPLAMTAILLLLGYLDVYSQSIKDIQTGEAFLPADCFWDPLRILDGASDTAKRNMQERELMVCVWSFESL